jgi:2-oxoisovalerate dehydrogenase E1 component
MQTYPAPDQSLPFGEVGVTGTGSDLAIVTFGNGTYLASQALPALTAAGLQTRVIDLRWLSPLPTESLLRATKGCKHILIVDETRHSGGLAEALMALFHETTSAKLARLTAEDSFIATGPAYAATLPSTAAIIEAAQQLCQTKA